MNSNFQPDLSQYFNYNYKFKKTYTNCSINQYNVSFTKSGYTFSTLVQFFNTYCNSNQSSKVLVLLAI